MRALVVLSETNRIFEKSFIEAAEANAVALTFFFIDEGQNCSLSFWREQLKQVVLDRKIEKILMMNDCSRGAEYLCDETIFAMTPCNVWFIDPMRRDPRETKNHLQQYQKVFSYEPTDVAYCQEELGLTVHYLPFPAGKSLFCSEPRDFTETEEFDISFLGLVSNNPKRLAVLEAAAQICREHRYTMALYGHFWHDHHVFQSVIGALKFRFKYPTLYPFVHNRRLTPEEAAALYRKTKVNLNIHYADSRTGPNPRTFEIMGNNNFELCDAQDFSNTNLVPGKHLAIYHDIGELKKQIVYYLENEKERIRIAKYGGSEVRKNYTFHHFLKIALA